MSKTFVLKKSHVRKTKDFTDRGRVFKNHIPHE